MICLNGTSDANLDGYKLSVRQGYTCCGIVEDQGCNEKVELEEGGFCPAGEIR